MWTLTPSEPPQPARKHKYRLQFVPSAWAEWQKLDGSVKEPLRKLLKKRSDQKIDAVAARIVAEVTKKTGGVLRG